MANTAPLTFGPASYWQLRAEYCANSSPSGDQQLEDQVTEIMHELGLRPLQLERILEAVLEAVRRVSLRGQSSRPVSLVRIRIWVAGKCTGSRSWGFFIVEKPGSDLQGVSLETEHLVELFLYQEGIL